MFKFEVPSLTVGTLDTLMNLSDDLGKTDSIMEGIVRKIERCAFDLGAMKTDLTVGGVPPSRYVQQFIWDSAKYPARRPMKELVQLIAGGATAVEEELKQLQNSYGEKMSALEETKRRKGGNLLSVDLNDVLTEEIMSRVKLVNTDYLKTVFLAIPKSAETGFESAVYNLGKDMVGYGGPDWTQDPTRLGEPINFGTSIDRQQTRGSPVVPGSLQKVHSDADSVLYAVTILSGQYEAGYYENDEFQAGTQTDFVSEFSRVCREKRFVVREDFEWDPQGAQKASMAMENLLVEVDGMKSALTRWCKNHYGDAFVAWVHMKVIRVFVESVLRYGLPVDFTAVLYKTHKEADLIRALDQQLGSPVQEDIEDDGEEFHEFVMVKFEP